MRPLRRANIARPGREWKCAPNRSAAVEQAPGTVKRAFETIEIDRERELARGLTDGRNRHQTHPLPRITSLGACWRSGRGQARGVRTASTGRAARTKEIYGSPARRLYLNNSHSIMRISALRNVRINLIRLGKYDCLEFNAHIILVCQPGEGIICLSVSAPHDGTARPGPAASPGIVGLGRLERDLERLHTTRSAGLPFLRFAVRSVSPHQAHHFPLHADAIRPEDPRFVGRIGGLQRNRGAPLAQSFERRFLLVDQRDEIRPSQPYPVYE